jgi:hypothetical protein
MHLKNIEVMPLIAMLDICCRGNVRMPRVNLNVDFVSPVIKPVTTNFKAISIGSRNSRGQGLVGV